MCIYFITIIDFNRHFVNFSNPGLGYRFWIRHLTTDVVEKIQRKCKKLCQLHDMVWFNICKIVLVINLIKKYSDYLQRLSLEAYLELSQISKMELFVETVICWKLHLRCLSGFWIRLWKRLLLGLRAIFFYNFDHCLSKEHANNGEMFTLGYV